MRSVQAQAVTHLAQHFIEISAEGVHVCWCGRVSKTRGEHAAHQAQVLADHGLLAKAQRVAAPADPQRAAVRAAAYKHPCPRCGVGASQKCRTAEGKITDLHGVRARLGVADVWA